jgi:hypothetical protein
LFIRRDNFARNFLRNAKGRKGCNIVFFNFKNVFFIPGENLFKKYCTPLKKLLLTREILALWISKKLKNSLSGSVSSDSRCSDLPPNLDETMDQGKKLFAAV